MTGTRDSGEQLRYQDLVDRDDAIGHFMESRKSSIRSNSWHQFGTALRHLATFLDERGIEPGDLDDDGAEELITWLRNDQVKNDETVKQYTGLMSQLYDYGIRRRRSEKFDNIDYNPIALAREDVPWAEDGTVERRDIPLEQMREAVLSIRHPLLLCVVVLFLKTGVRASELVNIDMRDINLDHHWFKEHFGECREKLEDKPDTLYIPPRSEIDIGDVVNGEERQDPNKRKRGTYIPIDGELKAAMLLWLAIRPPSRSPAQPFFTLTVGGGNSIPGDRLSSDYIWDIVTDWSQEQGWWSSDATLETNVSPHYFRHYFRTVFGAAAKDQLMVKYIRGDKGETMDDYMHYWNDMVREPYLQSIYKLF